MARSPTRTWRARWATSTWRPTACSEAAARGPAGGRALASAERHRARNGVIAQAAVVAVAGAGHVAQAHAIDQQVVGAGDRQGEAERGGQGGGGLGLGDHLAGG